jgi:hypothetical protein
MKNIIRASHNAGKKPQSSQAQTRSGKPARQPKHDHLAKAAIADRRKDFGKTFHLPKGAPHHACLAMFDREHQEPVTKIPLTEEEVYNLWLLNIKSDARVCGLSLEEFIASAVREKLHSEGNRFEVCSQAERVHQAVTQAAVLLHLVEEHLDWRVHRCGSEFTNEQEDDFNFGLSLLADDTRSKLARASKGMMDVAYTKPGTTGPAS